MPRSRLKLFRCSASAFEWVHPPCPQALRPSDFHANFQMLWRRSATKSRLQFSARRFPCCSRGAICSARRQPARARPPRLPCRCCIASARRSRSPRQTAGLMLVPTRELAMQVAEAVHKYSKGVRLLGAAGLRRRADARTDSRARARRADRRRHAGPRARSHPARNARSSTRFTSSCSTKPTRCSTWASPRISTRFSRPRRNRDRRRSSRRRCRRAFCRSPDAT